nr:hypothetical protein Itr_chr01CG14590 [Ipomoea trifida]
MILIHKQPFVSLIAAAVQLHEVAVLDARNSCNLRQKLALTLVGSHRELLNSNISPILKSSLFITKFRLNDRYILSSKPRPPIQEGKFPDISLYDKSLQNYTVYEKNPYRSLMEVRFQSSSGIGPVTSNAEESGEEGRLQGSDVARSGRAIAFDSRIVSGVLHAGRIDGGAGAQFST